MRSVINKDQFTPFGIWVREYIRNSNQGICVTNLDFVIEDFRKKKIMLLEEKQNGGVIHKGQFLTFDVLDFALRKSTPKSGYEYWGFFLLQFPRGCTMPGPGMTLNGKLITAEELQAHLNFELMFCEPHEMRWSKVK